MIARSFPRLRRRQLIVYWREQEDLLCYSARGDCCFIAVDECLRPASRRVLEGGIAHELCHLDADLRLGPVQRQFAWNRYGLRHCRVREERATELRAIELGYGPQLLAFVHFAHRLGFRFHREHGLLYPEIRNAIRRLPWTRSRS
jgi:hypothetical protein